MDEIDNKIKDIIPSGIIDGMSYIKCTYEIKDNNETQILNNKGEKFTNEEIESKIKMLNGDKKEKLIFTKKFDKAGIKIIYFIIEEKLNNMNYLFNKCKTLKKVEFFNIDTSQVIQMVAMFQLCTELEYLDLSSFDTSKVNDFQYIFKECN